MVTPHLAYSELTKRVYIVLANSTDKFDVTEQFKKFSLLIETPTTVTDNTLSPPSEASEQKESSDDAYEQMLKFEADDGSPSVVTQSEKGESAEEEKIMEIINRSYNKRSLINQFQPIELEIIHEAIQEYSLLERSRAIDECWKALKAAGMSDRDYNGKVVLETLEKLKSRQ